MESQEHVIYLHPANLGFVDDLVTRGTDEPYDVYQKGRAFTEMTP